jgi:hypothetical protein
MTPRPIRADQNTRSLRADKIIDLDPIMTYLVAQFGIGSVDAWTPGLRAAVKSYLVYELTDRAFSRLFPELEHEIPTGTREQQADFIVANHEPWVIDLAVHNTVVKAVSSLEQLVRALRLEPRSYLDYEDIALWLRSHATGEQLAAVVRQIDPRQPVVPEDSDWFYFSLGDWLATQVRVPGKLVSIWQAVLDNEMKSIEHLEGERHSTQLAPGLGGSYVIRTWARKHGYQVGERGRIAKSVSAAFKKASKVSRSN